MMHLTTLTPGRRALLVALICAGTVALANPMGRLALAMPLLLIAPGYLLERMSPTAQIPILSRCTLWMSLSLSMIALLYLWLSTLGLALSTSLLWGIASLLALTSLASAWQDLGSASRLPPPRHLRNHPLGAYLPGGRAGPPGVG